MPIFKQVILELLIDSERTFVMEPIVYVSRFLTDSGDSPLSTQVGGFSSEAEMQTGALYSALTFRARALEPGMQESARRGGESWFDAENLWKFQQLQLIKLQAVALEISHDTDKPEEEVRARELRSDKQR